jgi:uncharacterized protein YegP (UPF0339 family)
VNWCGWHGMQGVRPGCLRTPGKGGWIPAEQASSDSGRAHGGQFVLKKGSTGKFRFNLIATNGQVIATSEAYESKASAINGIESVKRNAPNAEIDDQTDK